MSRRRVMTLTTLGLSVRDETLVKSLLAVVGGSTRAEWHFVDEMDADLALCDPQSPFVRVALQKSERSGRPCCIGLLYGDASPGPLSRFIRAPLRVGELVEMLDALSDPNAESSPSHAAKMHSGSTRADASPRNRPGQIQYLVDVVRDLTDARDSIRSNATWRVEVAGLSLYVLMPERRYALLDDTMTVDALVDIALSKPVCNVIRFDRDSVDSLGVRSATKPLDTLLWRVGLRMIPEPSMPWLGPHVSVRLLRWPDFGRLGAHKAHLALAALLTKTHWRIDALLEASGQTRTELESFLCACGLCGLLDISSVAPVKVAKTAKRQIDVSGLFRSLRNALRIGD